MSTFELKRNGLYPFGLVALQVWINHVIFGVKAVRFLLRTSPKCLVPEIVFQRPGEIV